MHVYAKGLNIIVLASEEVSLKYVIHYQIEMNFARDRVILQAKHIPSVSMEQVRRVFENWE